jgi:DeoR family fructose operon transcriptional repressor
MVVCPCLWFCANMLTRDGVTGIVVIQTTEGVNVLSAERRARIVSEVRARPSTSTEDLALLFDVSTETVRRDLSELETQGLVRRVYGGAVPATKSAAIEEPYSERTVSRIDQKRAMARRAINLLHRGDTVMFDVGTSVLEIARAVPGDWSGLVLTNSVPVAVELSGRRDVNVLLAGGAMRGGDLATSGYYAQTLFGDYFADVAFIGSGGLSVEGGLNDYPHDGEAEVKRIMIKNSRAAYALVDSSKFDVTAAHRTCRLADLTGIIADRLPTGALMDALRAENLEVLTP